LYGLAILAGPIVLTACIAGSALFQTDTATMRDSAGGDSATPNPTKSPESSWSLEERLVAANPYLAGILLPVALLLFVVFTFAITAWTICSWRSAAHAEASEPLRTRHFAIAGLLFIVALIGSCLIYAALLNMNREIN
jgi:amino acid transporter